VTDGSDSPQATILHADLDAFFASVEQRDNPELRGKPVGVGKGVITAASYEAKARGVDPPTNRARALAACPELTIVPLRTEAYSAASREVFKVFERHSPVVEGISIDEAFLDVGGMEHFNGGPREIGEALRRDVREEVGLAVTVGIASAKFIAKIASGFAKPDGLLVVEPGTELEFLHPLDIERLWGVGKVTSEKLRSRGVHTIGDIAEYGQERLEYLLGPAAAVKFTELSNGRDPRSVKPRERRKSIGAQRAVPRRRYSDDEIDRYLAALVEKAAPRLRRAGRSPRTVVLGLRLGDFSRISRSQTLPRPTSNTEELLAALRVLLRAELPTIREQGLTLIGISFANLEDGAQLELDFSDQAKQRGNQKVDETLDAVRERFGKDAIKRGALVDHSEGINQPILPD
jgi:DNA polymerase-4